MLFQLNIKLSEDDYLSFNNFHSFESVRGKETLTKVRLFFILAMLIIAVVFMLVMGLTIFSLIYTALLLLFTLIYMAFYKKLLFRNMKAQIKRLKKTGKLPFDPVSTLEFYEDKMVEITASSRKEQGYNTFERVCVVKDRFILLYESSVGAYILPVVQVNAQLDQDEFLSFLSTKCPNVEYY